MRGDTYPWEVFEGETYEDLLLDTQIEYKAERIVVDDEWGSEVQYHVFDLRVTLRHNGHTLGVHMDDYFKSELKETIGRYLTNLNSY
jgi:hypothetical protein